VDDQRLAAPPVERVAQGDDVFFFFQAEDGIRDRTVTGVQTCALPILRGEVPLARRVVPRVVQRDARSLRGGLRLAQRVAGGTEEIGRASCRERAWVPGGGGPFQRRPYARAHRRGAAPDPRARPRRPPT